MATHEVTAGQQLGFSERLVTNAAFLLAGLCGNRSGGHCVGPGSLEGEMAELRSCVKVEVAALCSPSLIILIVSMKLEVDREECLVCAC